MYYRRKVILALLQTFDGRLDKVSFQKLLFLFTDLQAKQNLKPVFHFVPYIQGCFSFQSYADIGTMKVYHQIDDDKTCWKKKDEGDYFSMLNPKDKQFIVYLKNQYGKHTKDDLIKLTYRQYPYYAIKSIIKEQHLNAKELQVVDDFIPRNNKTILYTIGYEGISFEQYLNKLILNDVKVLCDVRKNSLSMKYGFSKNQLKGASEKLGIKYVHIPDLGIDSDKRQSLNSQSDYDRLFIAYEKTMLKENKTAIKQVLDLILEYKRIALTCFEAHPCQCHRGTLAKAITQLPEWRYELKHL